MSCAGNGYLTENKLIAFPFEDNQFLSWDSETDALAAQTALQKCFVDAGINLNQMSVPTDGWPSIGSFRKSGNTLSFVLTVGGTSTSLSVAASGTTFPIVSGSASWGWYVIVLSSDGIREFCASGFTPPGSGTSSSASRAGGSLLRLCPRCLSQKPAELTSIRVYDGVQSKSSGPHFILKGDVLIRPGNNMQLSEPDDENGIAFDAIPGAGMGVVPCRCTNDTVLRPPLFSSDGHSRFFNDTCYDIEPSVDKELSQGYLKIHAKCTACCTCSMYRNIVNERLAPLATAIRDAKSELSRLLSEYESAVSRFNGRISNPRLSDVTVSLTGMPVGKNIGNNIHRANVRGKMERCAFTATVRNGSYAVITANIYALYGTDSIAEVSASWSDEVGDPLSLTGDSSSSVIGQNFKIYPGRSLVVTFISVRNEMVGTVETGGYTGKISVGIAYELDDGTSGSLGVVNKVVEV